MDNGNNYSNPIDQDKTLFEEIRENRKTLYKFKKTMDDVMQRVEQLLPQNKDARSKYQWEERLKAVSQITNCSLDICKQIDSSIINEANLINKVGEVEENPEDTRKLVKQLEHLGISPEQLEKLNKGE
ncbi:MAG: hypothetical protein ACOCQD_02730 [archaeon]